MYRFATIQRHFWRYSRDKLCFIAVSSARRCIAACRFPSTTGFAATIDRRGFVGVIFPLMQSKDFLHHPVYISSRCSEYNRGSTHHRTFSVPMSFCSFLPLNIAILLTTKKQGNAAVLPHHDITPPLNQTHARPIPRYRYAVWVFCFKQIWVILLVRLYYTNFAPASTIRKFGYTNSRPCRGQPCAIVSMP